VLAEKRRQLDVAILAIGEAERSARSGREPDWELFKTIVREIEMHNSTDRQGDEGTAAIMKRALLVSPMPPGSRRPRPCYRRWMPCTGRRFSRELVACALLFIVSAIDARAGEGGRRSRRIEASRRGERSSLSRPSVRRPEHRDAGDGRRPARISCERRGRGEPRRYYQLARKSNASQEAATRS